MLKTTPLTAHPAVVGSQEAFRTETEARAFWDALPNKFEYAFKYIVSVDKNETIAVVLVPCSPELYKDYYVFGEVK